MLEKFLQDNKVDAILKAIQNIDFSNADKVDAILKAIQNIDFSNADISAKEQDLYRAILQTRKQTVKYPPIAELAEPFNLNELVGDHFNITINELANSLRRVDNIYNWINESNNSLKAELEGVEKILQKATDAVQEISLVSGDENKEFYWVSDTFNDSSFIDMAASTCLIDTDYGMATLGPQKIDVINNYSVAIDHEQTNGIPGCNLLILGTGANITVNQEPQPKYETADTKNLTAIVDQDPSSWFEIERNFIPPKQKLSRQGRAFVTSESTTDLLNVKEITNNFDWKIIVDWGDGNVNAGRDGKGMEIAEFLDVENASVDSKVKLVLDINLNSPTVLSSVKLLPLTRLNELINIDSIKALPEGEEWITVVSDLELGSNKATNKLQKEILRRTGFQSVGSVIAIPTDLPITKLKITLSSNPVLAKYGLAHPFKEIYEKIRTERNYVVFNTVKTRYKWERIAISDNPPTYQVKNNQPKLFGALVDIANLANITNSIVSPYKQSQQPAKKVLGALNTAQQAGTLATGLAQVGGSVGAAAGSAASFLGAAMPYVGAFLALNNLVGGLFHVNKSIEIVDTKTGYDIFKGYRAGIGLRGIDFLRTEYAATSTVQSVKRKFQGLVDRIGLFVDEYVPASWGPGEWISYSISEDGSTWVDIPKLSDTTLERSYKTSKPLDEIYFRAVLRGNEVDPFHSPALNHFALMGNPISNATN